MIKNNCILFFISLLIMLSDDVLAESPKICFYSDDNYNGEYFCSYEGYFSSSLFPLWNDRISSIKVPYGMAVILYENVNFSGRSLTLNNDTNSLNSHEFQWFNDQASSLRVKDAVCFYEDDNFMGDAICLSEGKKANLYNYDNIKTLSPMLRSFNDEIKSISVPAGMQVTIYQHDNFTGNEFTLTEDYFFDDLEYIGMGLHISSIDVSQNSSFLCDHNCAIKENMILPIRQTFGNYWFDEKIGPKQMLVSFKLTDDDDFLILIANGGLIKIENRKIFIIYDNLDNAAYFEMSEESDSLSMLSRFNGGYFEVQFIESIGARPIFLTPLIGYLFDPFDINTHFFIMNINANNSSVIIDKVVLTAEKAYSRKTRSISGAIACWSIPLLNIYNYIVQGHCNQVDRFVSNVTDFFNGGNDKILQVFGSSKPLPKISTNEPLFFEGRSSEHSAYVDAVLTHVNTSMDKKSLTIPATALACKVSMKEQLLPHMRARRDLIPPCIHWTLDIMTDFTSLFGGSLDGWNAENFGKVITRILQDGHTGHAVSDVDTETRLINNVRDYIAADENHEQLRLKTAFDFSQLGYATYLYFNNRGASVISPQRTQTLSLGRYELALDTFNYVETVPRIYQNGYWVDYPNSHFDVEIISGIPEETRGARQNVLPIINEWRRLYSQEQPQEGSAASADAKKGAHSDDVPSAQADRERIISASRIVSDVIQSWLRTSREDYVYVIVRLAGRIVSITVAVDINDTDVGVAGSLTDPAYVLHPESEGAIRGAGTAAIRSLAQYAATLGRRALVSEVISQPSAIVKRKVGFTFVEEL
ncbi:beta/gamma crystallin-related protein [Yersinia sp. Marseille-Q3913]|uniref:beta/gamma crystallin-related protein n=1 Tax=Yersinia sp. Marseille-Q3913 TaxID=2830769 RepID=UPI002012254B|nr:beta/gamma crystallin-related protein [Yersinia sp. Marseille-Q3913]